MRKIEHIGIAVKDIEAANQLYKSLLGIEHYKEEQVEIEGVSTSFFKVGDTKIELLKALNSESPIAKFIENRGEGLHHIAFEVEDIRKEMARLRELGFTFTKDSPSEGADNKLVCFVHPKSANGVLVELCQDIR